MERIGRDITVEKVTLGENDVIIFANEDPKRTESDESDSETASVLYNNHSYRKEDIDHLKLWAFIAVCCFASGGAVIALGTGQSGTGAKVFSFAMGGVLEGLGLLVVAHAANIARKTFWGRN